MRESLLKPYLLPPARNQSRTPPTKAPPETFIMVRARVQPAVSRMRYYVRWNCKRSPPVCIMQALRMLTSQAACKPEVVRGRGAIAIAVHLRLHLVWSIAGQLGWGPAPQMLICPARGFRHASEDRRRWCSEWFGALHPPSPAHPPCPPMHPDGASGGVTPI